MSEHKATMQDYLLARDRFIQAIKEQVIGPGSEGAWPDAEHELIIDPPQVRYSCGLLFPQKSLVSEEPDAEGVDDEEPDVDDSGKDVDVPKYEETSSGNSFADAADASLEEISMASQEKPASFGLTFLVRGDSDKVPCILDFATYRRAKIEDCGVPGDCCDVGPLPLEIQGHVKYDEAAHCWRLIERIDCSEIKDMKERGIITADMEWMQAVLYRLEKQLHDGWVRIPHHVEVELRFDGMDYLDANHDLDGIQVKLTALRRRMDDGITSLTVMVVNTAAGDRAQEIIAQPVLHIDAARAGFVFCDKTEREWQVDTDEEELSLAMLYRDVKDYATGLGTAAGWEIDTMGKGCIYNDFFPSQEVPSMDFGFGAGDVAAAYAHEILSMRYQSDLCQDDDRVTKLGHLRELVDSYERWIDAVAGQVEQLPICFHGVAKKHMESCRESARRMRHGLTLLGTAGVAYDAFALANRAMYMQRVQAGFQQGGNEKEYAQDDLRITEWFRDLDYREKADDHSWRPFQMAFLLMSIAGIVEEESPDRNLVDLIWFPTGGGKTEAYLGLAAFVIFYRRMRYPGKLGGGTNIIMRYTLRLLTAQQFSRAATLICACESIRRDCGAGGKKGRSARSRSTSNRYPRYELGEESITIGLWIGREHTPNKDSDAGRLLDKLAEASASSLEQAKTYNNKFQVLKCPWCGTKMMPEVEGRRIKGTWGYKMEKGHFYMACPHEDCSFKVGLPLQVVDEELYRQPPTLLIGTVDKFAMMTWKDEVGNFFGLGTEQRSPELVIQDELHLISGPLGSMVGLYETGLDLWCRHKKNKPKIIASTATIRRAKAQCSALYDRDVRQFPAPGIDAGDSYFARTVEINHAEEKFGRLYVGMMAAGKKKTTMEVRLLSALLQKTGEMDVPDDVRDMLWTLTVYFNSLFDLGHCKSMVEDDIVDEVGRMVKRTGGKRRSIGEVKELTSRVTTVELNRILDNLEHVTYSKENREADRYATSMLVSSNMISVGIDVSRLNVMAVIGQPKLTSEYIQATSRVGRALPGLVLTLYDEARSRDRSYYEKFKPYHSAFYRHVEPTGLTPFSKPARDRALHAVMVAVLRHATGLSEDMDAGKFVDDYFAEQVEWVKENVLHRVRSIRSRTNMVLKDDSTDIKAEMDSFMERWGELAAANPEMLSYGLRYIMQPHVDDGVRLLRPFGVKGQHDHGVETMTSMREIDSPVAGNVMIWEDEWICQRKH